MEPPRQAPEIVVDVQHRDPDPSQLLAEIRRGLLERPPETNPKWFYDDRGSALFEAICATPEYYPTRTERALLAHLAPRIAARTGAVELVELGPGNAQKTRLLLDAMARTGALGRYVPLDVSESMLRRVAIELVREYPGVRVHAVVADFMEELADLPAPAGERLVAFLGGTIGNFRPDEARRFLQRLGASMQPGDHFLLGTDLVKDVTVLEAAYDDAAGVTAEFNRNVLRVLNRLLGGDFDPEGFAHRAFYDRASDWIEMRLVSGRQQEVQLPAIDLELRFARGDEIRTEISAKYDRPRVAALLDAGGFDLVEWWTDPQNYFALSLALRRAPTRGGPPS